MIHNPGAGLVIRTTIACGVLETAAVILRLIARWKSNASIARDDWVLVAALVPSYAMLANGIVSTFGNPKIVIPSSDKVKWSRSEAQGGLQQRCPHRKSQSFSKYASMI